MPFLSTVWWYNKPNKSKNHTSSYIPFINCFCRKSKCLGLKIQNSDRIIKSLDNEDSNNWGPTLE